MYKLLTRRIPLARERRKNANKKTNSSFLGYAKMSSQHARAHQFTLFAVKSIKSVARVGKLENYMD